MDAQVICADGCSYERVAAEKWLATHNTSHSKYVVLAHKEMVRNDSMRAAIEEWAEKRFLLCRTTDVIVDEPAIARGAFKTVYAARFIGRPAVALQVRVG